MLPYRIKLKSILKADKLFIIFFGAIFVPPGLFLLALVSVKIFRNTNIEIPDFFIISCIGIAIGLLGTLYRYIYLKNILNNHVEVKGIIKRFFIIETEVGNYNNIEITYEYLGKVFNEVKSLLPGYKISRNFSLKLKKDAEITVLINPKKPKQFLIADLYVDV